MQSYLSPKASPNAIKNAKKYRLVKKIHYKSNHLFQIFYAIIPQQYIVQYSTYVVYRRDHHKYFVNVIFLRSRTKSFEYFFDGRSPTGLLIMSFMSMLIKHFLEGIALVILFIKTLTVHILQENISSRQAISNNYVLMEIYFQQK